MPTRLDKGILWKDKYRYLLSLGVVEDTLGGQETTSRYSIAVIAATVTSLQLWKPRGILPNSERTRPRSFNGSLQLSSSEHLHGKHT